MTTDTKDKAQLIYNWFRDCEQANLILSFKGDFSQDLVNAILILAEREPDIHNNTALIRGRVFSIMVECMQNICKYGAVNEVGTELKPGIVLVGREKGFFFLKTGNLVLNAEAQELKERLDAVKKMSKDELKQYHKDTLKQTQLSEKSGAGLGFISIARKSDKFDYEFRKLDERVSFFALEVTIASPAN